MLILGIETSCDETAASIVKDGKEVLSHVVASSAEMHIKTGGIIPEQAAREQVKSVLPVIELALKEGCLWNVNNSSAPPIDAIAVTTGPGLIGSLLVGVETAKTLSLVWNKPLVPVNHMVAHLYANWLGSSTDYGLQTTAKNKAAVVSSQSTVVFPTIALVVSGGHTDLVLMRDHGELKYIGGTRDDAAGEAFDKTARLLGLPYPGGPSISAAAEKFKIQNSKFQIKLPRPMIGDESFDFSFSGLKTAVARERSKFPDTPIEEFAYDNEVVSSFAHEIQEAITDVLVEKTLRAVEKYKTPTLLLAGGVAANKRLKEKFEERIRNHELIINFRVPEPKYCTDNASTIASCAFYNYHPVAWQKITANPSLTIMDGQCDNLGRSV